MNPKRPSLRAYSEEEKKMWRRHNVESRLEDAALSFAEKIKVLENLEEVARAFHGGKLPRTADEHDGQTQIVL
jgi:hypothetical protein